MKLISISLFSIVMALLASCSTSVDQRGQLTSMCTFLASTSSTLPIPNSTISSSTIVPSGTVVSNYTLPEHCLVTGVAGAYIGGDKVSYGTSFEMRLPLNWNGRFMFQGGGGSEGSVPAAVGVAGSLTPALAQGWAVIAQDGGHANSVLTAAGKSTLDFLSEPNATLDWGYGSIDKAAQTAKSIIKTFYGKAPDYSYHVGCSTGGRQGMEFMQRFPSYFDGVVAGDPVYDLTAITESEINSLQSIASLVSKDASGNAQFSQSFTLADQSLFTKAILEACDANDGAVDGVIDNPGSCKFDPATYVFKSSQPLKCSGAKTDSCLSSDQIVAIKRINQGPVTSAGSSVVVPSGTKVEGYPYDGGFMSPAGIPTRNIGTATAAPGNLALGTNQVGYYISPQIPTLVPYKSWNFDFDPARLQSNHPVVATSTNIDGFVNKGGKVIWYHGASDPGPSANYTINYFKSINSKYSNSQNFSRLYLVPNMGHCSGGSSTDQFDMLTPLMNWVEKGVAPDAVVASGSAFSTAPASRTRPLCAFPKTAKFTGAANSDVGNAANFSCQ
jgi:feruloyl esterase